MSSFNKGSTGRFRISGVFRIFAVLAACLVLAASLPALADEFDLDEDEIAAPPPTLKELEDTPKMDKSIVEGSGLPLNIRLDGVKEAAMSYGARAGLATRTFQIRQDLDERATYLDKIFDFRQLLIAAPSGLLIEPPIISEAENSMLIEAKGQQAALADRVYNISTNSRIVSAPRTWRSYLEREWGEVAPPPDILRPADEKERKVWIELVRKGWKQGMDQADDIFQDDLNRLIADYRGMVRYRMLLAQGMVSAPFALQVDHGVTGGGDNMRVGDRAVQITGLPELRARADQWKPANR